MTCHIKSDIRTTNLSFLTQVNIVSSHVGSNAQAATKIRRGLVTNIQPVKANCVLNSSYMIPQKC